LTLGRIAEIELEYQPLIPGPPVQPKQLYQQACSNDSTTVDSWARTWIDQIKANRAHVGDFAAQGIGKLFGAFQGKACVIAGSGPSLKVNGEQLKDRGEHVPLVSCLHNFHFFEDRGVKPDFYVSLDAGPVVIEEISEGGALSADEYWSRTKDHTLVAYIGSHPDLIKKWQGKIYFFNAALPHGPVKTEADEAAGFYTYLGSGGNVFGACMYFVKAILGCAVVGLVGADFAFDYKNKFHGWDSKYDKDLGQTLRVTDIYGVKVNTWRSYNNFKCWFEYVACQVPGFYVNCTEGGTLGAYDQGNIIQLKYMDLKDYLVMLAMNAHVKPQCDNPTEPQNLMLF
jgi:hypothetical protein